MRELGNLRTEGQGTQIGSYHPGMHEIHVLLVDHDYEGLVNTANLLELCQHRVTSVEFASAAISILSRGKTKFDLVMANINSPDSRGIELLQQAFNMDIPIISMSVDDNPFIAMRALENGAFLHIKKPTSFEMISYLWQHVLREKTRMIRERNILATPDYGSKGIVFREGIRQDENHLSNIVDNNMLMMKNQGKFEKKIMVRTKVLTEWTKELHAKFLDVVKQLGPGKCFPKEIRKLMGVPGLTRLQIASHLQKCRNDNWRLPEERKANKRTIGSSDVDGFQSKIRSLGSMPRLNDGLSFCDQVRESNSNGVGQSPQTRVEVEWPYNNVQNNMEARQIMNDTSDHQFFASMLPDTSNVKLDKTSSTKCKHPSEDFFVFQDMDCMIENYSTQPQGSGMSNLNTPPQPYHLNPSYIEQNSFVPSMGTQIHRSSETSNFRGDESRTRDRV